MTISPEAESDTLPVLYHHCVEVYDKMFSQATNRMVQLAGQTVDVLVYEGFLTKLITQQLNLSVPLYTTVTRALMAMGCVSQIRRGGSTSPSQWRLYYPPTEDLFRSKLPQRKTRLAAQATKFEEVFSALQAMNQRLLTLEKALQNVIDDEGDNQ